MNTNGGGIIGRATAPLISLVFALVVASALARATPAQGRPVVAEENAERRREALITLWDAPPGSSTASTGLSFDKWRAVSLSRPTAAMPVGLPGRWTSIGPLGFYGDNGFFGSLPQLDAGRVPTVAFHPTDRNTLYVGTSAGGVWKSSNEGASWTPLTDTQCSLVIGVVAIDPVNPRIVYAATGEPSETTEGCGILRSTDDGASWINVAVAPFATSVGAGNHRFYSLIVDRGSAGSATNTTLFAATNGGVYRSTNSGATWLQLMSGAFSEVVQHPANPAVLYAARRGSSATTGALFRSTDYGSTWIPVHVFGANAVGRIEMAVSPAQPGSVWMVASAVNSTFGGLFRWDDGSNALTTLSAAGVTAPPAVANRNNFGAQGNYDLMIAVDPTHPSRMYLGGVRAYRSTDGGATFTEVAPNIHCDWHVVVVDPADPRRVIAGSDGGVFLSRDAGDSFLAINSGLATTLHYPGLSLHPTDPSGVLTGMQDNGTIIARNGLGQWVGIFGGDGAFTATDHTNPDVVYVSSQNGNLIRVDTRTATYRGITAGIDANERRAFIAPFVIDPSRNTRLYFGGARLYRTSSSGTLWTAISVDLTRGSGVITAIAVAPSDSSIIYVGTSDANVRYSTDFGATWQTPLTALPSRSVGDISVDPENPRRAMVTFTSSGTAHVMLTTDGGANWTNIGVLLPDVTTQASAFGPNGRLFVGNMLGVWESPNGGATWARASEFPTIRVTDLVYNARTGRIVAATYGRGIWAYDFGTSAAVLRGDVNADGAVTAVDALLIQQALAGVQVQPTVQLFPRGDANCDGRIEIIDAVLVLRFAVGASVGGSCVGTSR